MKKHKMSIGSSVVLAGCLILFFSTANAGSINTQKGKITKCYSSEWAHVTTFGATIARGVDGDTVKIETPTHFMSIRLLSIDTLETHFQGHSQGYWAEKAAARVQKLLPVGAQVIVELDREKCDKYNRMLAYVYYNGRMLNQQILEEALAVNYCIYPNMKYCKAFAQAVDKSIAAHAGIFSDPSLELPYEWRRKITGIPSTRFVGNQLTYAVVSPGDLARVPVAWRVFFNVREDILPPYHLISQ